MDEKYRYTGEIEDKTMEECSEVIKAICKAKRFGYENTHPTKGILNWQLILDEINDVENCIKVLKDKIKEKYVTNR